MWQELFRDDTGGVHYDAPLHGLSILICVSSARDTQVLPGMHNGCSVRWLIFLDMALRDRTHLLEHANISGQHDGRHIRLLEAAIAARYYDSLRLSEIVYLLCCVDIDTADVFGIQVTCRKGRHRSVASAGLLASVLRFLGGHVDVIANTGLRELNPRSRFCPRQCCSGGQFLVPGQLTPVMDYLEEDFLEYIRAVPDWARDGRFDVATEVIEYLDYNNV